MSFSLPRAFTGRKERPTRTYLEWASRRCGAGGGIDAANGSSPNPILQYAAYDLWPGPGGARTPQAKLADKMQEHEWPALPANPIKTKSCVC